MASSNPSFTPSDIITDIESRLEQPGISSSEYLPWISYAYQKTFSALSKAGQTVKEQLFGAYATYVLTNGTGEYDLNTIAPRFESVIKLEILYGNTGDQRVPMTPMRSLANWDNMGQTSTSYQAKQTPLFYRYGTTLGIIPVPPASDPSQAILYLWYIKRGFQVTLVTDVIDIPYRFVYPLVNYVQAKAIQKVNQDYNASAQVEAIFAKELEEIADMASSEYNENDGLQGVETSSSDMLYDDPLRW